MRVAIIGGGISGLSLAYYLQKLGIPYDLFEGEAEVGGNIRTETVKGYLLECGPNALQMTDELQELIRELKLEEEVMYVPAKINNHFVLHDGSYHQLPVDPLTFRKNSLFSDEAKKRILSERTLPAAFIPNESVSQFLERRFGAEAADIVLKPLVSRLFAGDPDQLVAEKTIPKLKEFERKYGSVLKGLKKHPDSLGGRHFTFREGMHTLPTAIADKLISLHTERKIEVITRRMGKYILSSTTSHEMEEKEYDAVVLALPALQAAELIDYICPGMSAALQNINYPPIAVIHSVYNRLDVGHPLDGAGVLHPESEAPLTTGAVWVSSVFGGRCRPHEVLLTSFVNGAPFAEQNSLSKDELLQRVHQEYCINYNIDAEPVFQHIHYWRNGIPQYDLYIEDAHQMAQLHEEANLFVAANWQGGVSVPACIRHARELACRISLKAPLAQTA